jgi:ABC-2 type transport system permease protein
MAFLSRAGAIALRQVYLMRGSFARIMPMFGWVAIDMILWGFMSRYLNQISNQGVNFVPALLGAVLLWDFFTRVMHGVTTAFFEDVWSRNFLNVFASPLSVPEYLAGLVLSSIGTSAVGLVAMMIIAASVFGLSLFSYGVALFPFLMVLFLFGIALGVVGAALVLRLGPAAEWFVWPIPALASPFASVYYPISTLPHWMQVVSRVLPPPYVFENVRAVVNGRAASYDELAIGAALAIGYVLLACWFFERVYRRALRTGLIARFAAENTA